MVNLYQEITHILEKKDREVTCSHARALGEIQRQCSKNKEGRRRLMGSQEVSGETVRFQRKTKQVHSTENEVKSSVGDHKVSKFIGQN